MNKERNYGIDLLRIVSMFFVVILHCLGQGGILKNAVIDSNQYKSGWFLEIFAYCAVNIFALISGYVSFYEKERRVKYSRYFNIWIQVVFYGLLITLLFDIVKPELINIKDYTLALFPVTNNLYWYVTAYTGLFLMMPFLNKIIYKCEETTLKKLFVSMILLFSLIATIFNIFDLNKGYSFIWLVILYIMGAIIKRCNIGNKIKVYQAFVGIIILCIITYLYKIYGVEFKIFNKSIEKDVFISYTSPTILGASILYLIAFSKLKFNGVLEKIISFFASSVFSIYLMNTNYLNWNYIIKDLFKGYAKRSSMKMLIYVLSFSVIFVLGSILIDKIRIRLFKICKIDKLCEKMEDKSKKIITMLSNLV